MRGRIGVPRAGRVFVESAGEKSDLQTGSRFDACPDSYIIDKTVNLCVIWGG